MNPQRLVAAAAALAIGFGVTLAGVIVADDGDASSSSSSSSSSSVPVDEDSVGGEQADAVEDDAVEDDAVEDDTVEDDTVEDEAVEDEAVPEPAPAPADVESGDVEEPGEDEASQPSDQASQDTRVPIADLPDVGADCAVVYVVFGVDGGVAVLFDDDVFTAADGRLFFPGSDVSLDDLAVIEDIEVRLAAQVRDGGDGDVFVDCDDETLIAERNADRLLDDIERALVDASTDGIPVEGEAASIDFPCGDPLLRALERTYIEQFGLDVDTGADYGVVLVSLAQRVTAVSLEFGNPQNDLEFWVGDLQGPFIGFRTDGEVSNACALLTDNLAPAVSTREGFFCAIGQLASDDELLRFFDGLVPLAAGCAYPTAESGGFGSIRDETDQGEN